jgi:hypothetical protein
VAEARRLLLTTSITVADIGHQVGYHASARSVLASTAASAFPPITHRRLGGLMSDVPVDEHLVPSIGQRRIAAQAGEGT